MTLRVMPDAQNKNAAQGCSPARRVTCWLLRPAVISRRPLASGKTRRVVYWLLTPSPPAMQRRTPLSAKIVTHVDMERLRKAIRPIIQVML